MHGNQTHDEQTHEDGPRVPLPATPDGSRGGSDGARTDDSERARPNDSEGEGGDSVAGVTRRSFIRTAAGSAAAAAGGAAAASDEVAGTQDIAQRFYIGGEVAGWQGLERGPIDAGVVNPTLNFVAGQRYQVTWENLDGAPHNFVIQTEEGQDLVTTDTVTEQGATASVTFTATPAMAQYICVYHQSTMVGDIEVQGGAQEQGGGGGGTSIPPQYLLLVAAIAMAFLSPLLFALFLFSRDRGPGEGGAPSR
ncbi:MULTISPECIES: cupredoxin domain-containing protein [Halorussus]|uniref:cupredoxin domain-containing protein n=1 Tax=Halorussus TaxID=1070314 RepID=UPI00209D857A|nr:plastocyanin/azurin family copper-binding protein [Halorussus vallis]USZ76143.1 plastocyanin/azurin family copper-binding protein [Halorussus vallis]